MEDKEMYIIDSEDILKELKDSLPNDVHITHQELPEDRGNTYQIMSQQNPELKNCLIQSPPGTIFVVSSLDDEYNVRQLLYPYPLFHLIGQGPQQNEEILKTLLKCRKQNIWGIEKYLNEDAVIKSVDIYHSKDSQSAINELLDQIDTKDYFETPKDYFSIMANELISNAFYHMQEAPTTDRTQSIFVTPPMAVNLRIGIDQQKIALSVTDHSGTLTRDQVSKSLERSFREKTPKHRTPGAGLGLYLAFQHANQLIFNRKENQQTEIIAIIEASKRFLHYKQRVTSFHFFEEDSYV